jgi:hypothetical protein
MAIHLGVMNGVSLGDSTLGTAVVGAGSAMSWVFATDLAIVNRLPVWSHHAQLNLQRRAWSGLREVGDVAWWGFWVVSRLQRQPNFQSELPKLSTEAACTIFSYYKLERNKTADVATSRSRRDHRKSKFGLRHAIKLIDIYCVMKSEF